MGESLTQQRRVKDEGSSSRKLLSGGKMMTVPPKQAPANSVPAAAVIRKGQALFGIIGRKGRVGGFYVCGESIQLNCIEPRKLRSLRLGGAGGIPCVAVKCVEMGENTRGEGGQLDQF